MKLDMFVNAAFVEADGSTTVTARLRGNNSAKSFKLPKVDPALALEKNDGISVDVTGNFKVTEKYATPVAYKILDVKKGAYQPKAEELSAEDYLASIADAPAHGDEEVPF